MTRKEIEKRCLEEMQQNIPNSEALWQRIEAELPEQTTPSQPEQTNIRMTQTRRILTIAACFLFAVTSAFAFTQQGRLNSVKEQTGSTPEQMEGDDAPAIEQDNALEQETEQTVQENTAEENPLGLRTYESLHLPGRCTNVRYSVSGTQGEYFSEQDVLAKTECFVDAEVDSVEQDAENGELIYALTVLAVYGETSLYEGASLTIRSESAYVLEQGHLYLLPLYESAGEWQLAYECAPQIEMTLDGEAVHHNGWRSLMNDNSEALLYAKYGDDDYFYDRMYLTSNDDLQLFLENWSKNA